jgi:hypothetical protein
VVSYDAIEGQEGRHNVPQLYSYGCTVRMNFAAEAGLRTIDYYNITI